MKYFSLTNSLSEVLIDTDFDWIKEVIKSALLTYNAGEEGPKFYSSNLNMYQVKDEQRVSFSPAGTFRGRLEEDNLANYSSIITLTYKDVWQGKLGEYLERAASSPYTFAVLSEGSGSSFHVLVLTDSTKETHEIGFDQISEHYDREVGLPSKPSGKDLCHAIQVPHDAGIYYKAQCQIFPIKKPVITPGTLLRADITKLTSKHRDMEELLLSARTIPAEVYNELPDLLRKGVEAFPSEREKDIFLTGAIGILSGCFPSVSGQYDGSEVHANLNSFIVAPAASGKGALAYSKVMALSIHEQWIISGREAIGNDKEEKGDAGEAETSPETIEKGIIAGKGTPEQVLFIPANASSAAVLNHLVLNEGMGIMCETEADTMANSLKQDWGGYSDMIRKAFHHEPISYTRKTDREFAEILNPQLSVVLSGTPSQVPSLIKSAEDGLFSRFLYYTFISNQGWRDVSPQNGKRNLTDYFDKLRAEVLQTYNRIGMRKYSFFLTEKHWAKLNYYSDQWLTEVSAYMGGESKSIVIRLGLAQFRIAMLLSVLRHDERRSEGTLITCTDQDFLTAQRLASTYLRHALLIYCSLPKSTPPEGTKNMTLLLDHLPKGKAFTRIEAVEAGKKLNIQARTVDKYLKKLIQSGQLEQPVDYGPYKKV